MFYKFFFKFFCDKIKQKRFKNFVFNRKISFKKKMYPSTALAVWYKKKISKFFFSKINKKFFFSGLNFLILMEKTNHTAIFFTTWKKKWALWLPLKKKNNFFFFNYPKVSLIFFFSFLRGLGSWIITKLKFKGKSFRWYKKKASLVLRFGHSHLVSSSPNLLNLKWKRKGRMKILFYGTNCYLLSSYLFYLISWRPMNVYHGRGLRFAKQTVLKKAGKVSAYR